MERVVPPPPKDVERLAETARENRESRQPCETAKRGARSGAVTGATFGRAGKAQISPPNPISVPNGCVVNFG